MEYDAADGIVGLESLNPELTMKKNLIPLLLAASFGCSEPDINEPPRHTTGIVAGTVATTGGVAVVGATVTVTSVDTSVGSSVVGECVGTVRSVPVNAATNAAGYFVATVTGPPSASTVCIAVDAVPPPGSGLQAARVSGQVLVLRPPFGSTVIDTINISVTLGP